MKSKTKDAIFVIVDVLSLGGMPLVLMSNYPGQVASVMERLILSLPFQTTDNLGMKARKSLVPIVYF